ncbi:hypothetical protein [Phytohalomonas tamaricis]|uniref:hypothetical protein n=1 Tax=Phytohalomonas tamaricis TaxID=2081032 RepID=UPI001319E1CA|nr:hypothetical protein [Phytohalomonas tamaricis]
MRKLKLTIRTMYKFIRSNKAFTVLVAFIVGLVGLANNGLGIITSISDITKDNGDDLVLIEARLKPFLPTSTIPAERNEVFLQILVRNFNESNIILTSAEMNIINSLKAHIGRAGTFGRCTLSSEPNSNTPIIVKPGEAVWVTLSQGIALDGIAEWLNGRVLDDIHVLPPDSPITIAENYFVDNVNEFFEKNYGAGAAINAVLFTGIKRELITYSIDLSQGRDIFDKNGNLHHDWFIANWISSPTKPEILPPNCIYKD